MQTPQRLADSGWLPLVGGAAFLTARAVIRAVLPTGWHFRIIRRWMEPDDHDHDHKGHP